MGLDLSHFKATLSPSRPEAPYTFRAEVFDEYALDVLGFRRFLQTIPDFDYPPRILAVRDEGALEILRAHDSWPLKEGVEIFVGAPSALAQHVEEFERAQGLDGRTRTVSAASRWIDKSGCHISYGHGVIDRQLDERHWEPTEAVREVVRRRPPRDCPPVQYIVIDYPVASPYLGLYAEEVGYQRGGMPQAFYKEFKNIHLYVRRSDVEWAARLIRLSGSPEGDRDRREHFATQFLTGFVEGSSIFFASW